MKASRDIDVGDDDNNEHDVDEGDESSDDSPGHEAYGAEDVDAELLAVTHTADASVDASCSNEAGSVPMMDEAALAITLGVETLADYNPTGPENDLIRSVVLGDRMPTYHEETSDCDDGQTTVLDTYEAFLTEIEAAHSLDVAEDHGGSGAIVEGIEADAIAPLMSACDTKTLMVRMLAWRRHKRKIEARAAAKLTISSLGNNKHGNKNHKSVLDTYPNIGDEIEAIIAGMGGVGASAHRDTGVAVMNTARKMEKGTGWERIRLELRRREIYVSTSAIRLLCVARKSRTREATRHRNIVAVKCRCSVKRLGRFNMDRHVRNAFYRALHHIRDRTSVEHACLLERDDKAKTRMNSGESTCNVRGSATQRAPVGRSMTIWTPTRHRLCTEPRFGNPSVPTALRATSQSSRSTSPTPRARRSTLRTFTRWFTWRVTVATTTTTHRYLR